MKLKKSQLKELIRHAIVEDIMDKEIKNPKTGNKIKIRTALQLPDEHPANKKAKALKMGDMLPALVKAIQEQQTLIESSTDRIAALENN